MIAAVSLAPVRSSAPIATPAEGATGVFDAMMAMLAPAQAPATPLAADAGEADAFAIPVEAAAPPAMMPAAALPDRPVGPVIGMHQPDGAAQMETDATDDDADEASAGLSPEAPMPDLPTRPAPPVAAPVPAPVAFMSGATADTASIDGVTPRRAAISDGAARGAIAWRDAIAAPLAESASAAAPDVPDAAAITRETATIVNAPEAAWSSRQFAQTQTQTGPERQAAPGAKPAAAAAAAQPFAAPSMGEGDGSGNGSRAATSIVTAATPTDAPARPLPRVAAGEPSRVAADEPSRVVPPVLPDDGRNAGRDPASREVAVASRDDRPLPFTMPPSAEAPRPPAPSGPPTGSTTDAVAFVPAPGDTPAIAAATVPGTPPASDPVAIPASPFAGSFGDRAGGPGVAPPPAVVPAASPPSRSRAPVAPADGIAAMTGLDLDAIFPPDRDAPLTVSHPRVEAAACDAAFAAALSPSQPALAASDAGGVAAAPPPAEVGIQHHLDVAHDGAWLDRLARDIALSADRDSHMRFQLNPERLGALTVDVSGGADGANVRFTTDNDAARALIADAQPRLVAEARAQGMRIADMQVDVSGGDAGQQGGAANPFAQAQGQSGHSGQQQSGGHRAPWMGRAAGHAGAVVAAPARAAERYA